MRRYNKYGSRYDKIKTMRMDNLFNDEQGHTKNKKGHRKFAVMMLLKSVC